MMVDYPLSAATAERTPVMENMLARARAERAQLKTEEISAQWQGSEAR